MDRAAQQACAVQQQAERAKQAQHPRRHALCAAAGKAPTRNRGAITRVTCGATRGWALVSVRHKAVGSSSCWLAWVLMAQCSVPKRTWNSGLALLPLPTLVQHLGTLPWPLWDCPQPCCPATTAHAPTPKTMDESFTHSSQELDEHVDGRLQVAGKNA